MSAKKRWFAGLAALGGMLLVSLLTLSTPQVAYADAPTPGNCLNCHENLYFLHDTGKWFCLRESPMACVECHGGDPTATSQEKAHAKRAAYPVVNENITKCQECHREEAAERVQIFKQVAGIPPVIVAAAYLPALVVNEAPTTLVADENEAATDRFWPVSLTLLGLLALALLAVFVGSRQPKKNSQN